MSAMSLTSVTKCPVTNCVCFLSFFSLVLRLVLPSLLLPLEMSPAGTLVRGLVWTPLTTGLVQPSVLAKSVPLVLAAWAGGAVAEPIIGSMSVLRLFFSLFFSYFSLFFFGGGA